MLAMRKGFGFAAVAGGTLLFRINLCNLIFRCGCQSLWGQTSRLCNIHLAGMAHCPWCSHGPWGHNFPTGTILLAQAVIFFVPINVSFRNRFIFSVIAFFVVGAAVGLFFAVFSGYPVFLGIPLS